MKDYFSGGKKGQSIVEYSVLFVITVGVLIVAINGPLRNSLANVFTNLIQGIEQSVRNFSGCIYFPISYF